MPRRQSATPTRGICWPRCRAFRLRWRRMHPMPNDPPLSHPVTTASGREAAVPFAAEEYAARQSATRAALRARGLDALIVFAQESHYWLTGFDTAGYVFFQ